MVIIKLLTGIAINVGRSLQLAWKLISLSLILLLYGPTLVTLTPVVFYQISRPQEDLDTESGQDLIPETSQDYQISESAAATPVSTRPTSTLRRQNCFILGRNSSVSQPPSSDSSPGSTSSADSGVDVTAPAPPHSPPLSGSEGHDTPPEEAAPAKPMAEKGAVAHAEEQLVHHQNSASSRINAPTASQAALTDPQVKGSSQTSSSNEDGDAEMIKRRNIKMREEGVRVNVKYSQLAIPTRTPVRGTATATSSSSAGVTRTPSTRSSGSSSTSAFLSSLESPEPTPCSDNSATGISTPERQQQSSALPTSGRAGEVLYRIDEKLLATPADATSRRLLRDGRALLHQKKRTPRSASSLYGESGQSSASAEGQLRSAKSSIGYASELME